MLEIAGSRDSEYNLVDKSTWNFCGGIRSLNKGRCHRDTSVEDTCQ